MQLTIIDYESGNLFSVVNACRKLGYRALLSSDEREIRNSDKVIFPGVGNAFAAMEKLRQKGLDKIIPQLKQPVLGLCLGMQLMFEMSEEGNTKGMGIIDGRVMDFKKKKEMGIKVPHMGWNIIDNLKGNLFKGIDEDSYMYFVHSYYIPDNPFASATSYYAGRFTAAIEKDNFFGCQFHPEKSGEKGIKILQNFLQL